MNTKTIYIPCRSKKEVIPAVKSAIEILKNNNFKTVGLITTAQHLHELDNVKKFLEKNNINTLIGGQVLGCDQRAAELIENKIDAFLYIGSGRFHPLGVAVKTNKPVILCNPYSCECDEISDDEKQNRKNKQKRRLMRAAAAKTIGILISTKPGQFNLKLANELKEKLENIGKSVFLFAGESINPENVPGFCVDAFINTACPRINEDHFEKAVINPGEAGMIWNLK